MKVSESSSELSIIQKKIDSTIEYLEKRNYSSLPVLALELVSYFEGDAPSGDAITLPMILNSKWLLLHEVIELSELKKKGFTISSQLLFDHSKEVFSAHLTATSWELALASQDDDANWVQKRLEDIKSWLTDSSLPPDQVHICKDFLANYSS